MEDIPISAITVLNIPTYSLSDKIKHLSQFKEDIEHELTICKNIKTKKYLKSYLSWLNRQIKSLNNNCPFIVK